MGNVCVSDFSDFSYKAERIYIAQDGDKHVCFTKASEENIDTMASVCTMRWRYVRQIPAKDKFELAQEQVDNIKKNLEQLEYALSNKYEVETLIRATHVQGIGTKHGRHTEGGGMTRQVAETLYTEKLDRHVEKAKGTWHRVRGAIAPLLTRKELEEVDYEMAFFDDSSVRI